MPDIDPYRFKPLRDGVLVRDLDPPPAAGRIILALENPECVDAISGTTDGSHGNYSRRPVDGVVIACGPGRRSEKGVLRPMSVKPGDRVRYTAWNDGEAWLPKGFRLVMEGDIWWKHEETKKARAARAGN